MGLKLAFFCLLFFAVSQVIAISELHIRSLEVLEARQGCTACTTVADTAGNCTTVACVCNPTVAATVQACVNCAWAANPSPDGAAAVQNLIDVYARTCAGVAGVPSITTPPGFTPPTSTGSGTILPATTTTRPQTVTTPYVPPTVIQTTVGPDTTTTNTVPGPLPPVISQSESDHKRRWASFAAIGAVLVAALVM